MVRGKGYTFWSRQYKWFEVRDIYSGPDNTNGPRFGVYSGPDYNLKWPCLGLYILAQSMIQMV